MRRFFFTAEGIFSLSYGEIPFVFKMSVVFVLREDEVHILGDRGAVSPDLIGKRVLNTFDS